LSTDYETMSVWERFSFAGPDVRLRSSTVEGLSNNASFCLELRVSDSHPAKTRADEAAGSEATTTTPAALSPLGW
jgi:hypothetical protein